MTDLRTRIIAALLSEDDVALMADAVIRELDSHGWLIDPDSQRRAAR